jgi:hypothetical protein
MVSDPGRRRALARLGVWAALVAASVVLPAPAAALASPGPALSVDASSAGHHPISPDIYGLNFAGETLGAAISVPVDRWGGNTTDTYNYRLGSANTGTDYYFENVADCFAAQYDWCSGLSVNDVFGYRTFVAKDRRIGAASLITLPMTGYVAKDAPVGHPLTCGYPKTTRPSQDAFDPFDANCGDGKTNGTRIAGTPSVDGTPAGTAWNRGWVADLTRRYGTAASGGVRFYELGNEPSLWADTHSDVHPAPENATELWGKSASLATAVKDADPSAKVLGFSEWGWPGYFCTEADTPGNGCDQTGCTSSPDCAAHGHSPMAPWFLRRFAAYDAHSGVRHLDYMDVHYYAQGGSTPDITRSLWDPTYTDPSWIGTSIHLIPRMKCWVDGHVPGVCASLAGSYPGTKLSLSEYNLSLPGVGARTNAIIQADTLGIFGREGLDLATRWPMGYDGNAIPEAFKLYRDYDGAHSQFGDVSVRSTSADQGQLAVYGARRTSDGAYTIVVLNKTGGALHSSLRLTGITATAPAQTWRWTGGAITEVSGGTPVQSGVITATYPEMSMTLYVIG